MTATIPIHQGTFTLPDFFTKKFGFKSDDVVVLEDTPQGILMKPCQEENVRIYTDEEVNQWEAAEKALEPHREWLEAELAKIPKDGTRWGA
jgi:bifunctional DNA-binding transcriptional regulator/antitoxin component of YhaV-PrlF toxin-antitoxin module